MVLSVALLHFGFLMATIYTIDPASAVSTGVHQTLGTTAAECAEEELDLQGWKRAKYLCPTHMSGESASLFQLCDAAVTPSAPMEEGRTWSTFCGRANDPGCLSATTGLIAASLSLHLVALVYKGPGDPAEKEPRRKRVSTCMCSLFARVNPATNYCFYSRALAVRTPGGTRSSDRCTVRVKLPAAGFDNLSGSEKM